MRDNDDEQTVKIEPLSQWKLEAESRNFSQIRLFLHFSRIFMKILQF